MKSKILILLLSLSIVFCKLNNKTPNSEKKQASKINIETGAENYYNNDSLSKKIETTLKNYIDNDNYQGAVLVVKDGKILFNKAYGFANRENKKHFGNTILDWFSNKIIRSRLCITIS